MQILDQQIHLEVGNVGMNIRAVIKRHVPRQLKELFLILPCRLDGTRKLADIVSLRRLDILGNALRAPIGAFAPARRPDNQQTLALVHARLNNRQIDRLDEVTGIQQLLLNKIHLIRINPLYRKNRPPVLLGNSDNDVSAAPVVDVIGKGADRVGYPLGIPPFLVLDASPLHLAVVDQIVNVYR